MRLGVIALAVVGTCVTCCAHQDVLLIEHFDNVTVVVETAFEGNEEVRKAFIAGRLAHLMLQEQFEFSQPVLLYFHHAYARKDSRTDSFLGFDRGELQYTWSETPGTAFLQKDGIVIRQVGKSFQPLSILKILDFAVRNLGKVKADQCQFVYDACEWEIRTIDPTVVGDIAESAPEPSVAKTMKAKMYREADHDTTRSVISYFYQAGKYHIFSRQDGKDKVQISLDDIHEFHRLGESSAVIFDTDSSFYYARHERPWVLKRHTFTRKGRCSYRPYMVQEVTGIGCFIGYWYMDDEGRDQVQNMLYVPAEDRFVQDFSTTVRLSLMGVEFENATPNPEQKPGVRGTPPN